MSRVYIAIITVMSLCSNVSSQKMCIDTVTATKKYSVRDYPAVGILQLKDGACSAFLVDVDVAMTAAHCINYETAENVSDEYLYIAMSTIKVIKHISLYTEALRAKGLPDNYTDMGFLILEKPVPGVSPMRLAKKYPRRSDVLAMVGHGCVGLCQENDSLKAVAPGVKRISYGNAAHFKVSTYTTDEIFVCPGDSGAPLINLNTGEVIGIVSSVAHTEHDGLWLFENSRFANTVPLAKELFKN